MKKLYIKIYSDSLGDTLAATPTIRKLYNSYGNQLINVVTHHKDIFKNNSYVEKIYSFDEFNSLTIDKNSYELFETFYNVGKKNEKGVEKKHSTIDIRQFHAIDLGFCLNDNEMEYDYIADEIDFAHSLPKNYVAIHVSNTWPSRTYSSDKWQKLVDKLNENGISVVLLGKNSSEQGFYSIDKKVQNINLRLGMDLTNKLSLSECWHVINNAACFVTMDSGLLHLAGTTDVFIVQLGSSINNKLRAPFRKGSQNYKYKYISGPCDLFCASNIKYNVKEWGTIQGVPPLISCLENKKEFECHPDPETVFSFIKNEIIKIDNDLIDIFEVDKKSCTLHYRTSKEGRYRIQVWDCHTKGLFHDEFLNLGVGANYWTCFSYAKPFITNDINVKFLADGKSVCDRTFNFYKEDNINPLSNLRCNYNIELFGFVEVLGYETYKHKDIKIDKDDVVVDIGCNLSAFTIYALKNGASKVYACEPNPDCIKSIKTLLGENSKVILNEIAIADKNGEAILNVDSDFERSGHNKLQNAKFDFSYNYKGITVKTKSFNSFINESKIDKIDFLKLDCEGSEVFVFVEENKSFIKNNVNKIALEYHSKDAKINIVNYLEDLGFEVYLGESSSDSLGMMYAKNKIFAKKKILFLTPHLSTGGAPKYLEWLINKKITENYEVKVVEWNLYSTDYTVQRNNIIDLIGVENFFSMGSYKQSRDIFDIKSIQLVNWIKDFNPDVIHLNEYSENFSLAPLTESVLKFLYDNNRKHELTESCHSASTQINNKINRPNKLWLVSNFHCEQAAKGDIPYELIEMELNEKERPNREQKLLSLNLDPKKYHVLQVGLFHKNKNQKFTFDLAKEFDDRVEFHFIGNHCYMNECGIDVNQTNCRIWGERSDVESFMSCMDLFVMPSFEELNPIALKEALSWRMPCFINPLITLESKYRDNPLVHFINEVCIIDFINTEIENRNID